MGQRMNNVDHRWHGGIHNFLVCVQCNKTRKEDASFKNMDPTADESSCHVLEKQHSGSRCFIMDEQINVFFMFWCREPSLLSAHYEEALTG